MKKLLFTLSLITFLSGCGNNYNPPIESKMIPSNLVKIENGKVYGILSNKPLTGTIYSENSQGKIFIFNVVQGEYTGNETLLINKDKVATFNRNPTTDDYIIQVTYYYPNGKIKSEEIINKKDLTSTEKKFNSVGKLVEMHTLTKNTLKENNEPMQDADNKEYIINRFTELEKIISSGSILN